jgi:hypothetical protein
MKRAGGLAVLPDGRAEGDFALAGPNWYHFRLRAAMVNYILLYKIRRIVKRIIKDKIADDEIATTPKSCIGCLADDISWEVYYLLKEKEEKDGPPAAEG